SQGLTTPVIGTTRAFPPINVKEGGSFAMAGLLNNQVRQSVGKIPLLGDLPIIGALFRSTSFQNNETELLFMVTVKLVNPAQAGSANVPDPTKLMELRDKENREFTLMPGFPGVGEVVERPFGQQNINAPTEQRKK